jgi:hypothetical protein
LTAPRTVRAGDDDRQRVMELLQAHYVAGRLSSGELEERVERALAARTLADLDGLLADLPRPQPAAGERSARGHAATQLGRGCHGGDTSFRAHATSYLLVMALLVTIWLLTSPGGYFWPVWPMLGWGVGLASHGLAARGRDARRARLAA